MKYDSAILLFLFAALMTGFTFCRSGQPTAISSDTLSFTLGDTVVFLEKTQFGSFDSIAFVHLHGNEKVALEAAKMVLFKEGGTLLRILNENNRKMQFPLGGYRYTFDPNRMFTGVVKDSVSGPPYLKDAAVEEVKRFAQFFLSHIPDRAHTVVALHNNFPYPNLDIHTYTRRQQSNTASIININSYHDKDDFFLTNDSALYRRLANSGFNVVLQNNKDVQDDGSLSVYYRNKQKRFVTVEAQHSIAPEEKDHLEVQVKMLEKLTDILKGSRGIESAVLAEASQ